MFCILYITKDLQPKFHIFCMLFIPNFSLFCILIITKDYYPKNYIFTCCLSQMKDTCPKKSHLECSSSPNTHVHKLPIFGMLFVTKDHCLKFSSFSYLNFPLFLREGFKKNLQKYGQWSYSPGYGRHFLKQIKASMLYTTCVLGHLEAFQNLFQTKNSGMVWLLPHMVTDHTFEFVNPSLI